MAQKVLDITEVINYYNDGNSLSATARFFNSSNTSITKILTNNGVHLRSKEENELLRKQAYARTCLARYGIENPAKLEVNRAKFKEVANRQAKPVDEAAVIQYYLEPNSLARTASTFHISAARAKQILIEANVLRLASTINKNNKQAAIKRTNDRYQKLIPDIIEFYSTHTLNATKLEFKITVKVLRRLLTSQGVELRSKEEDYAMSRKVQAAKYKETIRQKYISVDSVKRTILEEQKDTFVFDKTFITLKAVFLKLGGFIDNEYLDKYIHLILANTSTKKQVHKTQAHHIIPRAYYSYNKLKTNNLDNNLINLFYKDHILAHYYLALCTTEKLQECNVLAFSMMTNYEYLLTVDELALVNDLDKYQELHEQYSRLNAKTKSNDNSDRVHIHKGTVSKMVKQDELNIYLSDDWVLGRAPHKTRARKVYCVELDQTFASITAASKQLNIHINNIGICLRKQGDHYTAGGYHWKYVED